uniref:Pecanex-like protein n=1 Tax=Schistocephalus solidus TaxID=70667 RepID=A0A183SAF1_SCHSO
LDVGELLSSTSPSPAGTRTPEVIHLKRTESAPDQQCEQHPEGEEGRSPSSQYSPLCPEINFQNHQLQLQSVDEYDVGFVSKIVHLVPRITSTASLSYSTLTKSIRCRPFSAIGGAVGLLLPLPDLSQLLDGICAFNYGSFRLQPK